MKAADYRPFRDRIISQGQGDAEWLQARCGCITASSISDVMAKLKRTDGESASRLNYKWRLVAERLSGVCSDSYVSSSMDWGVEQEPIARAAYEIATGNEVERVGFVLHPSINYCGASPDGLVEPDGLLEIKCPNSTTHLQYIMADVVPADYRLQMLWQMECCERQWCDFVSYDPRMPERLQLFVKRFQRDETRLEEIRAEVSKFNAEVADIVACLGSGKTVEEVLLERTLAGS